MKILSASIITVSLFMSLLSSSFAVTAGTNEDTDDKAITYSEFTYKPEIEGTIRGKFEYQPSIDSYRFQVRNARVGLKGWVAPIVDYKAELDLCDEGKIKVLDIYGRVHIKKVFSIALGQMRMPFSVDATRSPYLLYFANRSFIAKQVGNVRDVGIKLAYTPTQLPLTIEAGVFNGSGLTEQKKWHKDLSFAAKANYKYKRFRLEFGVESIIPDSIRINLLDASLSWDYNGLFIEGEYIYKHYTQNSFKNVHAYNIMANYKMPIKGFFKNITFGARFDSMSDHSSGIRDASGQLTIDDSARKRLTGGVTLSFIKQFQADLRLNYEQYFYSKDAIISDSDRSKIVVELMVHF